MKNYYRRFRLQRPSLLLLVVLSFSILTSIVEVNPVQAGTSGPVDSLQKAFASAAQEFGVPEALLLAVSYNLTRWDDHSGLPSYAGGYGLMQLTELNSGASLAGKPAEIGASELPASSLNLAASNSSGLNTLKTAAQLLGLDPARLKREVLQNLRGGAALLAQYGRETSGNGGPLPAGALADWYGAVVKYSGSKEGAAAYDFADSVYETLQKGARRTLANGQQLSLAPMVAQPNKNRAASLAMQAPSPTTPECPVGLACDFVPAAYQLNSDSDNTDYGNYDLAKRGREGWPDIRYIVIHDTEISYNTTLQAFQNPFTYSSSHYVIRSSDGHVTQMVKTDNVAWHAGNWYLNTHAIGIEHEGVAIDGANWYSEPLYRNSARLVRYLAAKYHIPLDRQHILGHDELPGPAPKYQAGMHWDPGPFWDWNHYMELLGAPLETTPDKPRSRVVMIKPNFATNTPPLTYCYQNEASDCRDVPLQSANFVYLYTAPSLNAPLITDPYFPQAAPTLANNWADKAVTGQEFYVAERQGDWDAIYFGGQKAWFYNPCPPPAFPNRLGRPRCLTADSPLGNRLAIRPKAGLASIAVYGTTYPETAEFPADVPAPGHPPLYSIPAGQVYVVAGSVKSDYYYAPEYILSLEGSQNRLIKGATRYYQIFFNHRLGYVKASDVDLVGTERDI